MRANELLAAPGLPVIVSSTMLIGASSKEVAAIVQVMLRVPCSIGSSA